MKNKIVIGSASFILSLLIAGTASAHVIVTPNEGGIGAYQTFSMAVPVERNAPTIAVKLLIPPGLEDVSPNVMPGWNIVEKRAGTSTDSDVTEIDWTGGIIPIGEREDFLFNAKMPGTPEDLDWKAYQTYQDGTVVSWDQTPIANAADDDSVIEGPYSITHVINDLDVTNTSEIPYGAISLALSLAAVALSVVAILIAGKKKNI